MARPDGYYKGKHLEFSFTHSNAYGENYFSFVNGQYTSDGGTHLAAFKEGFLKGVQEFYRKPYKSEDVREGMTAAIVATAIGGAVLVGFGIYGFCLYRKKRKKATQS